MNTKEANEFLKSQKYSINQLKNIYRLDSDMTSTEKKSYVESLTNNKKFNQIIALLKHGEKYEQMWEELKYDIVCNIGWCEAKFMYELEQKYFPKDEAVK